MRANFFPVFILDSGKHCFVWIGSGASHDEKRNGLSRAHVSDLSSSFTICPLNNFAFIISLKTVKLFLILSLWPSFCAAFPQAFAVLGVGRGNLRSRN